jgi:hypothetical protein
MEVAEADTHQHSLTMAQVVVVMAVVAEATFPRSHINQAVEVTFRHSRINRVAEATPAIIHPLNRAVNTTRISLLLHDIRAARNDISSGNNSQV